MSAAIGVGLMFSLENRARNQNATEIDSSPPAVFLIKATAATLEYGGTEALRKMIQGAKRHHIYAVDEEQHELLGRHVPDDLIKKARTLLNSESEHRIVEQVHASDGHTYLLFLTSSAGADERAPLRHGNSPSPFFFPIMPILASTVASLFFAMLL
eukprot:gene48162-62966_t